MVEFIQNLGYKTKKNSGRAGESAKFYLNLYKVDFSHFINPYSANNIKDLDAKLLEQVPKSKNWRDLLTALGYKSFTSVKWRVEARVNELKLDISHFTKTAWNKGKKNVNGNKVNLDLVLVENSTYQNTSKLKKYLVEKGILKYECRKCGISKWQEEEISLQLEHINGKRSDNRKENLELLCPNCHSQTPTWGSKRGFKS